MAGRVSYCDWILLMPHTAWHPRHALRCNRHSDADIDLTPARTHLLAVGSTIDLRQRLSHGPDIWSAVSSVRGCFVADGAGLWSKFTNDRRNWHNGEPGVESYLPPYMWSTLVELTSK